MAKKRANGEGSIRKRKDGRWEGRYTAGHNPETGKAIYKNVLGKTQAEVKEKLKKAIEDSKGLDIVKAGEYTIGQWMDFWLENYAKLKVRPSSYQTYKGFLNNHIKPAIGSIPLPKLTTMEMPRGDIGRAAIEMLYQMIEGKHPEDVNLQCKLIQRQSTAV